MIQLIDRREPQLDEDQIQGNFQEKGKEQTKYQYFYVNYCLPIKGKREQKQLLEGKEQQKAGSFSTNKENNQLSSNQDGIQNYTPLDQPQQRSKMDSIQIILFFSIDLFLVLKYLSLFLKPRPMYLLTHQPRNKHFHIRVPASKQPENFEIIHGFQIEYLPLHQLPDNSRLISERLYFQAFKQVYLRTDSKILWRLPVKLREPHFIERITAKLEHYGIICINYNSKALVLVKGTTETSNSNEVNQLFGEGFQKQIQPFRDSAQQEQSIQRIEGILIDISFFIKRTSIQKEAQQCSLPSNLKSLIQTKQTRLFQIQVSGQADLKVAVDFINDHDFVCFIKEAIAFDHNAIRFRAVPTEGLLKLDCQDLNRIFQQLQLKNSYMSGNMVCRQLYPAVRICTANRALRSSSLLILKDIWNQGLYEVVMNVLENWEMYQREQEDQLIKFTLMLFYKIKRYQYNDSFSLFDKLYPRARILADELRMFFKLGNINQVFKPKGLQPKDMEHVAKLIKALQLHQNTLCDKILDALYDYYCRCSQSQQNKEQQQFIFSINKPDRLAEIYRFVADKHLIYTYLSYLRNAISLLSFEHKSASLIKQKGDPHSTPTNILHKIHEERLMDTNCLGCATFFYNGMNILDEFVNCSPLKTFRFIADMKSSEMEIKDYLCAMLNSCGGIMLFECKRKEEKVVVEGAELTQKDKEEYEQRFMSYLESFYPKNDIKRSVAVSFVPVRCVTHQREVAQLTTFTGQQSLIKPEEQYIEHAYMPAMFVMRVKVSPANPTAVYIWKESNNLELEDKFQRYTSSTLQSGKIVTLKMKNLHKQIKQKMKMHFMPSSMAPEEVILQKKESSYFNHECKKPEAGICRSMVEYRSNGPIQKESYAYASMIVVNKSNFQLVRRAFKHFKMEVKIQILFEDLMIRTAKHTAIMYHSQKLQNLLRLVRENPMFTFKGRPLLIINITNYLKLSLRNEKNPYGRQDFQNLLKWVKQRFLLQTMRAFIFKVDENVRQYYIKCDTHEMTLFTYYVLNQFNEKTVFKNPLFIDKMEASQLNARLIELYPDLNQREEAVKKLLEVSFASTLNKSKIDFNF